MDRWHIVYRIDDANGNWSNDINWYVDLVGSLTEVINQWLQIEKKNKIIEVVDIYKVELRG